MKKSIISFNTDPTISRVAIIAMLLMAELLLIKLLEILQTGRFPTPVELTYCIILGLLQLVTYILTFMHKTDIDEASKIGEDKSQTTGMYLGPFGHGTILNRVRQIRKGRTFRR